MLRHCADGSAHPRAEPRESLAGQLQAYQVDSSRLGKAAFNLVEFLTLAIRFTRRAAFWYEGVRGFSVEYARGTPVQGSLRATPNHWLSSTWCSNMVR